MSQLKTGSRDSGWLFDERRNEFVEITLDSLIRNSFKDYRYGLWVSSWVSF